MLTLQFSDISCNISKVVFKALRSAPKSLQSARSTSDNVFAIESTSSRKEILGMVVKSSS